MSKKIVLTSCGIINENLKEEFYKLLNKEIDTIKVLYITTAIDGEDDSDTSWIDEEFKTIFWPQTQGRGPLYRRPRHFALPLHHEAR